MSVPNWYITEQSNFRCGFGLGRPRSRVPYCQAATFFFSCQPTRAVNHWQCRSTLRTPAASIMDSFPYCTLKTENFTLRKAAPRLPVLRCAVAPGQCYSHRPLRASCPALPATSCRLALSKRRPPCAPPGLRPSSIIKQEQRTSHFKPQRWNIVQVPPRFTTQPFVRALRAAMQ